MSDWNVMLKYLGDIIQFIPRTLPHHSQESDNIDTIDMISILYRLWMEIYNTNFNRSMSSMIIIRNIRDFLTLYPWLSKNIEDILLYMDSDPYYSVLKKNKVFYENTQEYKVNLVEKYLYTRLKGRFIRSNIMGDFSIQKHLYHWINQSHSLTHKDMSMIWAGFITIFIDHN